MDSNGLAKKIATAALEVGGKLKADKKNLEQHYDYISADKILSEVGQALFTQGVAVIPEIREFHIDAVDRGAGKNPRLDAQVSFVIHVTDGTANLDMPWAGMGSDYSTPDKALYKAITSGHKYFLMKLLCIGEGNEDSEHEGEEDEKPKPRPPVIKKPEPTAVEQFAKATPGAVVKEDGEPERTKPATYKDVWDYATKHNLVKEEVKAIINENKGDWDKSLNALKRIVPPTN